MTLSQSSRPATARHTGSDDTGAAEGLQAGFQLVEPTARREGRPGRAEPVERLQLRLTREAKKLINIRMPLA